MKITKIKSSLERVNEQWYHTCMYKISWPQLIWVAGATLWQQRATFVWHCFTFWQLAGESVGQLYKQLWSRCTGAYSLVSASTGYAYVNRGTGWAVRRPQARRHARVQRWYALSGVGNWTMVKGSTPLLFSCSYPFDVTFKFCNRIGRLHKLYWWSKSCTVITQLLYSLPLIKT